MAANRRNVNTHALPYRIPGPAGNIGPGGIPLTSSLTRRSSSTGNSSPSNTETLRARLFLSTAWQSMLQQLKAPPYGSCVLHTSVALLRNYALCARNGIRRAYDRNSLVAVRLDSLSYVGKDASVTLSDPTAVIAGTLHAQVFVTYKGQIEPGVVLLLRGVMPLAYPERAPTGFGTHLADSLHVSIQTSNIQRIFTNALEVSNISTDVAAVKKAYTNAALNPPPPPPPPLPTQNALHSARSGATPRRQRTTPRPASANAPRTQQRQEQVPQSRQRQPPVVQQGRPGQFRSNIVQSGVQSNNVPRAIGRTPQHTPQPAPRAGLQRNSLKRPFQPTFPSPRPGQRPRSQPASTPVAASSSSGVAELTEDQLDSLLGNVDIDAMIAASQRTKPPPPSEKENVQGTKVASNPLQTDKAGPSPGGVTQPITSAASNALNNVQHMSTASSTQTGTVASKPPTANKGLGGIDDSMLDNLLDGLDSADFS